MTDFNTIELAWAYVKRLIRRVGPREDASHESVLVSAGCDPCYLGIGLLSSLEIPSIYS